jgi:Recombination endonuclease VII
LALADYDTTKTGPPKKSRRSYSKKYYRDHRKEFARNREKWERSHPEAVARKIRRSNWKHAGMDPNEAEKLYNSRKNCDICGVTVSGKNKHVDHDHATGKLRGILCNNCNVLIGLAEENPDRLSKATEYLSKHQDKMI